MEESVDTSPMNHVTVDTIPKCTPENPKSWSYQQPCCRSATDVNRLPGGESQMYTGGAGCAAITQTMRRNSGREERLKTGLTWSRRTCFKSPLGQESLQLKTKDVCFPGSHQNSDRYSGSIWLTLPITSLAYYYPLSKENFIFRHLFLNIIHF